MPALPTQIRLIRNIAEDVAAALHALNTGDVPKARAFLEDVTNETRLLHTVLEQRLFADQASETPQEIAIADTILNVVQQKRLIDALYACDVLLKSAADTHGLKFEGHGYLTYADLVRLAALITAMIGEDQAS